MGYTEEIDIDRRKGDYYRQLAVYTAVSKVENVGCAASILIHRGIIIFRSGVLRGVTLGEEAPSYLQEAALVHSLRKMQEWYASANTRFIEDIRGVVKRGKR